MVTRNRSRKASIDNEELPVEPSVLLANEDVNAEQTSSFLCAESKDEKEEESDTEVCDNNENDNEHDNESCDINNKPKMIAHDIYDLDGDADYYADMCVDDDDEYSVDETRVCNDIVAMSAPYIREMAEKGMSCAQYIYSASSLYLFWIMLHYFSTQMYVYYCAPRGFYGFLISPFLVAAPHCRAIRWIIHNGGNMVDNMWIILGTWLCSKIITGA
jgi:hypothetical protein